MLIFWPVVYLIIQVDVSTVNFWEQLEPVLQALPDIVGFVQRHLWRKYHVHLNEHVCAQVDRSDSVYQLDPPIVVHSNVRQLLDHGGRGGLPGKILHVLDALFVPRPHDVNADNDCAHRICIGVILCKPRANQRDGVGQAVVNVVGSQSGDHRQVAPHSKCATHQEQPKLQDNGGYHQAEGEAVEANLACNCSCVASQFDNLVDCSPHLVTAYSQVVLYGVCCDSVSNERSRDVRMYALTLSNFSCLQRIVGDYSSM